MKRIHWLASWLPLLLVVFVGLTQAQATGQTHLQIRLRYSDGTAVTGETITLQRLPEEEPVLPNCTTDSNGECTWYVGRGLYQLLFTRPLDNISALAVAEGGLRGLGITVGDTNIVYHFTFHSDGRVYFDAAPEAAVPSPIIPVGDVLHGGIGPSPTPSPQPDKPVGVTATRFPEQATPADISVNTTPNHAWHLLLFIGGGLVIGGGLHFWSRRKRASDHNSKQPNGEETNHA